MNEVATVEPNVLSDGSVAYNVRYTEQGLTLLFACSDKRKATALAHQLNDTGYIEVVRYDDDGLMDGLLKTSAHGSATVKVYRCPSSGWTKTANRFYLPGDTSRDVSGVDPGALVGRAVLLNSYCCICDVEHWHVHMVDDPDGQHEQVLIWRP